MVYVIIGTCHQVTSTQIQPFQLRKPATEFFLDMLERAFQLVGIRLTMTMTVETFNTFGQLLRKQVGRYTETCTRRTRVIELYFHLRIFGIDTDAA